MSGARVIFHPICVGVSMCCLSRPSYPVLVLLFLPVVCLGFQVKEAVAEAEASLPEVVTVIPAGVGTQRTQDVVQSFLGANVFSVSILPFFSGQLAEYDNLFR